MFSSKVTRTTSLSKLKKSLKKVTIKVGLPKTTGATVHQDGEETVATIGMYNEFGTSSIPERPFIRSTMQKEAKNIKKLFAKETKKILRGEQTPKNMMGIVGEYTSGQIKRTIVELKDPPNSDFTVAKKRSSNPLIDSGQMIQSITYEVAND